MPLPDLDTPDLGHANLAEHIYDHLQQLADSFLLGQTAADFAQTVLTNFANLQQAVTDQGATIAALQQSVSDQGATITDLQTTVSDLQATVTSQGDDIATLQTQVADLETRVSALENPTPAA